MRLPSDLILATGNAGKRRDLIAVLHPLGVRTLDVAHGPVPIEDADSYEGNAAIKALAASRFTGHPALADDSGIEVDALDGGPGLTTRRWAMDQGGWGAAAQVILDRAGPGGRARYICALALSVPGEPVLTVRGVVEGVVVGPAAPEGSSFDPVFRPLGAALSFGQMSDAQRRACDHRRAALEALLSS